VKLPSTVQVCPCDTGQAYDSCCGRWHRGALHLQAPDALALMRSRYSAFVLMHEAYLLNTWHPSTRPLGPLHLLADTRWLGLQIRRHVVLDATHASVEFVARSKRAGRAERLHEVSRFVWEQGQWWYTRGAIQ
jgi:SEC-C motif domain protein